MKTALTVGITVVTMIAAAAEQPSQAGQPSQNELLGVIVRMAIEIKSLHLQVRRLDQDLASHRLWTLEQEFEQVQARRARREAEERDIRNEVAVLDQLRKDPLRSETELRALEQTEASRDLRPGSELTRVVADKDKLSRREAELRQQMETERQRLQQARTTAEMIEAELLKYQPPAANQK